MSELPKKFKEVYEEYYLLHPDASTLPSNKLHYLHRQWIFPNHIDVMLEYVGSFRHRFYPGADLDVALFAALLHDAGLVYKRANKSPLGHEARSCEYATNVLSKHGFEDVFIAQVCDAIRATEPTTVPDSEEAILVRNADAYSHLTTMHFFAKAYFADGIEGYISWFSEKIHSSIKKLTIPELIEEARPVVEQYDKLVEIYFAHRDKRFVDSFKQ